MGWEDRGMENEWMDRKISDLGEEWGGGGVGRGGSEDGGGAGSSGWLLKSGN